MYKPAAILIVLGALLLPGAEAATPAPEQLRALVAELCDPELEGRVIGSNGIERAADLIADSFQELGLKPAGVDGGWFQPFTPEGPRIEGAVILPEGAAWGTMRLKNVAGLLPGRGEGYVVVGAHYDHLGRNREGALLAGADDNVSGVAILWAVAAELAEEAPLERGILFLAFSGEEEGLLGSRWYVDHPILPLESTIAMLNLDTVGRMEEDRLYLLSTETAAEFPQMARGINLAFGFDLSMTKEASFSSDHTPFLERGVPSVHLFTGPRADYHRPGDTPEKLDYEKMSEIASFTAEAVRFLADRDQPLTFLPPGADEVQPPASGKPRSARRVSLGTIPDFGDQGEGVLISGVLPASPAEKAGMRKGDRVVSIDGEAIGGLEDFSIALKSHEPGDRIQIGFEREGKLQEVNVVLVERK